MTSFVLKKSLKKTPHLTNKQDFTNKMLRISKIKVTYIPSIFALFGNDYATKKNRHFGGFSFNY